MFERWTLRSRFSRRFLVATRSSLRDSERERALSPNHALWEIEDALRDESHRVDLCDMNREGHLDLTRMSNHELIRMVRERIESGRLVVVPLDDEPFHAPAPQARPIGWVGWVAQGASTEPDPEHVEGSAARKPVGEPYGREKPPESSEQRALSASAGDSPQKRAARDAVAREFYRKNCPGMSEAQIDSHVRCIDKSKPVKVVKIPPEGGGPNGDQLHSWVAPGQKQPGQYFTNDPSTKPDALGIDSRAIAPASGDTPPRVCPRALRTYTVDPRQPAAGLQSTAAPANDTWSVPGGRYSPDTGDLPSSTNGGGTQILVPRGNQGGLTET